MASIVVNGWFWRRPDTGSRQYLAALRRRLPARAPRHRFRLLVLDGTQAWAKGWWEQVGHSILDGRTLATLSRRNHHPSLLPEYRFAPKQQLYYG